MDGRSSTSIAVPQRLVWPLGCLAFLFCVFGDPLASAPALAVAMVSKTDGRSRVRRVGARLRQEEGISIVEMTVVAALLALVLSAMLLLLDSTAQLQPKEDERAHSINEAHVGLYRMTRELRPAKQIYSITGSSIDVRVPVNGVDRRVAYRCNEPYPDDPKNPYDTTYTRCVRSESALGVVPLTGGAVVIDRVTNGATVFSPITAGAPWPKNVNITIQVPSRGTRDDGVTTHRFTLENAIYLRNIQ